MSRSEAADRIRSLASRLQEVPREAERVVATILAAVRRRGDRAVCAFTRKFDGVALAPGALKVSRAQIDHAHTQVDLRFLRALDVCIGSVERFHQAQVERSYMLTDATGSITGLLVRPIPSVGVYVPGGRGGSTPLISTAVMGVVPARIAGVARIAVASPPRADGTLDPCLLVALDRLGVTEIYKAGGAQAIGAMAFGTQSLAAVDKIVGPGNLYVALAKRAVSTHVDVDKVAGPSEIVVLADRTASPELAAADMLAQAEHDPMALAVLVTTDLGVGHAVARELERQLADLPRAATASRALRARGVALVMPDLAAALATVNAIAPEHLEVLTEEPMSLLGRIDSAGAIFLGPHSPQAAGDYVAGPNHTLPTGGTARRASPLGVWDFIRRSSVVALSPEGLSHVSEALETLASLEGLEAHARSSAIRRTHHPSAPRRKDRHPGAGTLTGTKAGGGTGDRSYDSLEGSRGSSRVRTGRRGHPRA